MMGGLLRDRVIIDRPQLAAPNELGERVVTWYQWIESWARIERLSGRELEIARQSTPTVTHRITVRHTPGLVSSYRLRRDTEAYSIEAVLEEPKRRQMVLLCTGLPAVQQEAQILDYNTLSEAEFNLLQG